MTPLLIAAVLLSLVLAFVSPSQARAQVMYLGQVCVQLTPPATPENPDPAPFSDLLIFSLTQSVRRGETPIIVLDTAWEGLEEYRLGGNGVLLPHHVFPLSQAIRQSFVNDHDIAFNGNAGCAFRADVRHASEGVPSTYRLTCAGPNPPFDLTGNLLIVACSDASGSVAALEALGVVAADAPVLPARGPGEALAGFHP